MNLFDLLTKKNKPEMTPIQLSNDGSIDNAASLALKNQTTPLTLGERLTGRTMTQDTQTIDPQTGAAKLETLVNYRPGLLNDIAGGYKENRFTPANLENFGQNTLAGGRNKGFAYRLGEGLGSLARFGESPLGRSLLVGGAIGALGGSPAEALTFGAVTGATNQMNRIADKLYRNQLKNYGYNDEDLNNINGYVTKDNFNTLALNSYRQNSLNVRRQIAGATDNTKRANIIMTGLNNGTISPEEAKIHMANYGITFNDLQKSNNSRNADINEYLAPHKANAYDTGAATSMMRAEMQGELLPYQIEKLKGDTGNNLSNSDKKTIIENKQTLADIDAGLKLINENPDAYSLIKGVLPATITNRLDPKGVKTRTQIDNITAVYRKWLTGAQMSDQERKAYERFLPAPTDNEATVKAKLQGMRDSIERKNNIILQNTQQIISNNNDGWAF